MHYYIQLSHTAPPASGYAVWVYLHGAFSTADQAEVLFGSAAHAQQVILLAPQASRPCGDGFWPSSQRASLRLPRLEWDRPLSRGSTMMAGLIVPD